MIVMKDGVIVERGRTKDIMNSARDYTGELIAASRKSGAASAKS